MVIIGAQISRRKEDKKHPYGHEKFECVAAILLSFMLFATAITVGVYGFESIRNGTIIIPSELTIWAALLSIVIKEWMYRYTKKAANKINSTSLYADAWHHRSDALSSIGSLIGVVGAICGFPILDPIASFVICLIIIKVAYDILKTSFAQIIDSAAPEDIEQKIREIILTYGDIEEIDMLKSPPKIKTIIFVFFFSFFIVWCVSLFTYAIKL